MHSHIVQLNRFINVVQHVSLNNCYTVQTNSPS